MELRRKPPNACGMLRENTVTITLCVLVLLASEWMRNSPVFEFQSCYREHHFEARATLPPIIDVCVAAFLFCLFRLNKKYEK